MEIQKYQSLLSDIENWLKAVNIPVNTLDNMPNDEATIIDEINECNFLNSKLKEKLRSLKDIQSNCDNLTEYHDVEPLAVRLSEQLTIILSLINEQQIIITKRTDILQTHLQQLREQPASIQSTDNTIDSSLMPEEEIVQPKIAQVYEVETQTSESLQKPTKDTPIDEEQQTSFPLDDRTAVETFDTSVQTVKEKKPTDNISVTQTYSEGHETIKFESAPNPTISEITEDVFVDAKYQQVPPGETVRTSELVLRNVPQSFETTFTEPDETTTEVVCDPDGTKRIIVRKLTRTRQHIVQQNQQQQLTTVATLMGPDNIPVTQSVSQINLENQVSTNTVSGGGGTKTTISKQGKGLIMSGTSPDSMVVHEFEHEPEVEEYVTNVTQHGIPVREGVVTYVDGDNMINIPTDIEPGYEESSIRAVVQQVTRRIIRKTRKIIKRVVVINGVEHVTEEVVEEPEEIEITEEETPQVNVNIVRTVNGKVVTSEQYEDQVPQSGVSTIISQVEEKMQMKGEPIKDVEADTQVFEIIQAPVVELVIVDPAPVDITSDEITDGKLEPSQDQQAIIEVQEVVKNIENIWPYEHHLDYQGLEVSQKSDEDQTPSEPSIKEESAVEEIWPKNLNTGSEFVLETYEFDARPSSVIDEVHIQSSIEEPVTQIPVEEPVQELIEEIDVVDTSESKSEEPIIPSAEVEIITAVEVTSVINEQPIDKEIPEDQPEVVSQAEIVVEKIEEQVKDGVEQLQDAIEKTVTTSIEIIQSYVEEPVESLQVEEPVISLPVEEPVASPQIEEPVVSLQVEEPAASPQVEEPVEPIVESISTPVEEVIEQTEKLISTVIIAEEEPLTKADEPISTPVEEVHTAMDVATVTPVDELVELVEESTHFDVEIKNIVSPTPVQEETKPLQESITISEEEHVTPPEQRIITPEEESIKLPEETVVEQFQAPTPQSEPEDIVLPIAEPEILKEDTKVVIETVTVTLQEQQVKEIDTADQIPKSEQPQIQTTIEEVIIQEREEPEASLPKKPIEEEIPLIKPIPTIDVRRATHLFLEAEAVAADPHTQTIKLSLPAKGTQSPSSVTVTMKVDADEEQPKVNVNLVEESQVPITTVADIVDSSKSDDSKRSRKKKKRKDKDTSSKEESEKTPESIDPSVVESVELVLEDDNTISEHMEMPEEVVIPEIVTPPSDRDNVQETGYEPIDETAEEDHKDDKNKKKKKKKKQKVKAIADDESLVAKSVDDESRGDDTPLESESDGIKHEEEKEITPDESLKSIISAVEDSVKIIEESVVSSPSDSPKPLVTEVVVTKSIVEEMITSDVEQQTSPVEIGEADAEPKPSLDVRSMQTSPEQKESTMEISLQTSPEPAAIQLEQEMQTSPTEQSEVEIQTTPVKFDEEERITIEQTTTEIQTDDIVVTEAPEQRESSIQTTIILTEEKELQTSPTDTPRSETVFPTEDIVRPIAEQLVTDICNTIPMKIAQTTESTNTEITTTVETITQTSPVQFANEGREVDSPSLSTSTEEPYEIQIEASFTVPDGGVQSLIRKGEPVVMEINKSFKIDEDGVPVEVFDDADDQKKKKKKKIKRKKGDKDIQDMAEVQVTVTMEDKTKIDETRKFLEGEQYRKDKAPFETKESIFEPESQLFEPEPNTQIEIFEEPKISTETIEVTTTVITEENIPQSQDGETLSLEQHMKEMLIPSAPTLTEITEVTGPEDSDKLVTLTIEQKTIIDTHFDPTKQSVVVDEVVVEAIQPETEITVAEEIGNIEAIEKDLVKQPEDIQIQIAQPVPDTKTMTQSFLANEQYTKAVKEVVQPYVVIEKLDVEPVQQVETIPILTEEHVSTSEIEQIEATPISSEQELVAEEPVEVPKDQNVSLIITKTEVTFMPPTDIIAENVEEIAYAPTADLLEDSVNQKSTDREIIDITKSFIDGEQYQKPMPFQSISVRVVVATTEPEEHAVDQEVSHNIVPIVENPPIEEEKPSQKENLVQLTISKTTVTDSVNEQDLQPVQQTEEKVIHQKKTQKAKPTSSVTIEEVMSPTEELVVPLTPGLDIAAEYERAPDSIWTTTMQNRAQPSSQELIQMERQETIHQRPTTLIWTDTNNVISNRIRQMNNARNTHLGDVLTLATLGDVVTEEPIDNRVIAIQENLGVLQEAIDRQDTIVIQRSVVTIIETISTWLETIEYRVYLLRQQSNDAPSEENIQSFDELKDELHVVHEHVAQFAKDLKDAGNVVSSDERDKMNKCFATLSDQVKTIEEVTKESEVQALSDLKRWNEYLEFVEQIIIHITNLQERYDTIVNTEIKTEEKLVLLDDLENRNQEQGRNIAQTLSRSRSLMRDYPSKEIPQEVYGSFEASRNLENNIFLERNRLLQLQTLAAEYEQTLNEFTQITLLADTLVEQPIVASTLEELQQEMQKHRKFFVNLSHCRSILESLEENLDNETRIKHAELHQSLYSKASAILGKYFFYLFLKFFGKIISECVLYDYRQSI